MTKKVKASDYMDMAEKRNFTLIGPIPETSYHKTTWMCSNGHIWQVEYRALRQGNGCPHCSGNAPKNEKDYKTLADNVGITHIGCVPKNTKTNTEWMCGNGHVWNATFDAIQRATRCPHCAGNARKTVNDYVELAHSRGFTFVGPTPTNVGEQTAWRCQYGHEWKARYDNIKTGRNCPMCSWRSTESLGAKTIADTLKTLGIEYEKEKRFGDCRYKRPLPFDFYFRVNGTDFICEYHGAQHFLPIDIFGGENVFMETVKRDKIKSEWAKANGFKFITIDYTNETEDIPALLKAAIKDMVQQ